MRTVSGLFALIVLANWVSAVAAFVIAITDFSPLRMTGAVAYAVFSAVLIWVLVNVLDRYAAA